MSAPDAVIFDLDGLLLESESAWNGAKRRLTEKCGGTWTGAAETDMLGMSSPEWSRYMRDELGVRLEADQISAATVELLTDVYRAELPLLPGAHEAVAALSGRWPLGLASSSNREIIDLVLERTGWAESFSVTVSSEEVERGKPAPDVYLEAARRLGLASERCVAVEDSSNGIRSAHASGAAVIAIPNREYPPEPGALALAHVELESLAELIPDAVARAAESAA